MTYTMPEILLAIAAVGAVLTNAISAWRTSVKVDQTLVKAAVIEGHVNSKETKYVEQLTSMQRENDILKKLLSDKDATAALLAQAAATPKPVV